MTTKRRYAVRYRTLYYTGTINADERWRLWQFDQGDGGPVGEFDSRQDAEEAVVTAPPYHLPHGAYGWEHDVITTTSREYRRALAHSLKDWRGY